MKQILTILLVLICQAKIYAEITLDLPEIAPVAPEVAAMAKYVDYPVDPSTGVPDITIPLFEIKDRDLVLPITLTYHASGFKPNESAGGLVGLGWTLNAEPSVGRTIRGLPDDANNGEYKGLAYNNNRWKRSGFPNADDLNEYLDKVSRGILDEEPDNFYYKLAQQRGSFYMSKAVANAESGTGCRYIPHPYKPVTVINTNVITDHINMQDENGIKYSFGYNDNVEKLNSRFEFIYRWLCTQMQSPVTGAQINFEYTEKFDEYATMSSNKEFVTVEDRSAIVSVVVCDGSIKEAYKIDDFGDHGSIAKELLNDLPDITNMYNSYRFTKKCVRRITYNQGSIDFHYSTDENANDVNTIKRIIVRDNNNQIIKQIDFFISNYVNGGAYYKLDSVKISVPDPTCETQSYRFQYYGNESGRTIPAKGVKTKNIDHWGYFNDSGNDDINKSNGGNGLLFPTLDLTLIRADGLKEPKYIRHVIRGANRESNENAMISTTLREIIAPTGVKTTFTYEANKLRYRCWDESPKAVGGIRVTSIKVQDANDGAYSIRNYQYLSKPANTTYAFYEGGIARHRVTEKDYCFQQEKVNLNTSYGYSSGSRLRTWSASPRINNTINGATVVYSYVKETQEDKRGTVKETVYYYKVPLYDSYGRSFFSECKDKPYEDIIYWDRESLARPDGALPITVTHEKDRQDDYLNFGQLIQKEVFQDSLLMSKTEYTYGTRSTQISSDYPIRIGKVGKTTTANYTHGDEDKRKTRRMEYYVSEPWNLTNGFTPLIGEKETLYSYPAGGGEPRKTETIKKYTYNEGRVSNHMKPVQIETMNGIAGNQVTEYFAYPENVPAGTDLGQDRLKENYQFTTLLEHKRTQQDETMVTRAIYKEHNSGSVLEKVQTNVNDNGFRDRVHYHHYMYGNAAEVSQTGQPHICYIWSYQNQYPVAKIDNCTYAELNNLLGEEYLEDLAAKEEPDANDMDKINNLRTELPNAQVTTFTYEPNRGVSSITTPNEVTTYFEYDGYGRMTESFMYEDNQKKVLQSNEYHFGEHDPAEDNHFLIIFNNKNNDIYMKGNITFSVTTSGNWDNISYCWTIMPVSEPGVIQTLTSDNNSITVNVNAKGRYVITCAVWNNTENTYFQTRQHFYVVE